MAKNSLDLGLLLLRISTGVLLFTYHGWGKLLGAYRYFALGQPWSFIGIVRGLGFPAPGAFALLSMAAEAGASALLVIGLFGRWPAVIIAGNMAVAVWLHLSRGQSPELPILYLVPAVALAMLGPGRYSLGRMTGKAKGRRS